ncbi:MAG: hypothetical protein UY00_C0010G0007 [Candidatus Wolfebacteria bacterium GW2011_GWA1_47_6]|nr:MAG: hypothetical protein UY00_C0010G0007 [Candidatus Wolfebacteria bacterium GW2011_GWA1_47_6]
MATSFDEEQNQYLEIHIELKKDKEESAELSDSIAGEVFEYLRQHNSEFRELSNHLKERAKPKINLWPAEHPTHFKTGTKQKWIQK